MHAHKCTTMCSIWSLISSILFRFWSIVCRSWSFQPEFHSGLLQSCLFTLKVFMSVASVALWPLLFQQIAFLFTIYPSLVLTYAGQTAYLIKNPNDHDDGFYKFIPTAVYWPIFIIATSAAIVASQSLISATFSVIKQSVVLDYFPRVKVVHTSRSKEGEVYSPEVNYILMILCVAVILIFGDGKDIGNAFGMVNK